MAQYCQHRGFIMRMTVPYLVCRAHDMPSNACMKVKLGEETDFSPRHVTEAVNAG
jgi:hypothetical protein